MIPFFSGSSITVLALTATEVMRADFTGGNQPRLANFAKGPRSDRDTLAIAAELAVSLFDSKPSKRTVVLAEDFWSGVIDIDDRSIFGLQGAELDQVLKYETESLANMDPMSCLFSSVELMPYIEATRRFWCTSVASEDHAGLSNLIQSRGGKLYRLGSTLGLAGPGSFTPWVEFHASIAAVFAFGTQAKPKVAIMPRSSQSERWYQSLEDSFEGNLPSVGWLAPAAQTPRSYEGVLTIRGDGDDADARVRAWIETGINRFGDGQLPLIVPPTPETPQSTYQRVGAVAAVAALGFCILDYSNSSQQFKSMTAKMEKMQEPAAEQKRMQKEIREIEQKVKTLEEDEAVAQLRRKSIMSLTEHRERYSELLRLVANSVDENMVVDDIALIHDGLMVSGRSVQSSSPSLLANRLMPHMGKLGWRLDLPKVNGANELANGGPWKFSISLVDTVPVDEPEETSGGEDRQSEITNHAEAVSPGQTQSSIRPSGTDFSEVFTKT